MNHYKFLTGLFCLGLISCLAIAEDTKPSMEERLKQFLKRFPTADGNKDGVLTREEVAEFNRKRRGDRDQKSKGGTRIPPTHQDVKYGEHKLQAFDLWLAKSAVEGKPTPLCIYIHGGGFRGGDKRGIKGQVIQRFLDEGISFASMNYRLTNGGEFPYPVPMHDSARGLQFIRAHAEKWNLDPTRIVCYGGSAGAGISLWLAFGEDRADPESDDPVARQSTRILAAGTSGGQSTYDMRTFREWFGVPNLKPHDALVDFYAMKESDTPDTPRVAKLAEDASAINHLTKDDPARLHDLQSAQRKSYHGIQPGTLGSPSIAGTQAAGSDEETGDRMHRYRTRD